MSRGGYRGPKLPRVLLDKVHSGGVSKKERDFSRKDRRKAEREARRQPNRPQPSAAVQRQKPLNGRRESSIPRAEEVGYDAALAVRKRPGKDARPVKSILKKKQPTPDAGSESETDRLDGDKIEDESENEHDDLSEEEISQPVVSRSTKRKLEEDDAEIAALEKKLKIKGKTSKALEKDGLDWIVGGPEGESEDDDMQRPEDLDWLRNKRRKASKQVEAADEEDSDHVVDDRGLNEEEEIEEDAFADFGSEEEPDTTDVRPSPVRRQVENPYMAPGTVRGISAPPPAKYIPPSLRKPATSDEEMLRHLHRQILGKINKVSESNMISVLREVEDLYKDNARQHVTSTLIDILGGLMTADVAHPDTVLITNAAFATALFKVVGTDFGAQLLETVVDKFIHFKSHKVGEKKQPLNLLAFLSFLYNFQVVGCGLLFDHIRILLEELTEYNTEILLRIMRISGQQLRQDDPSALKDIVMLLQKLVTKSGEDNLSVRTKFMIETMNNLKNNRVKTGLAASTITTEQMTRMKKTLGTLNARAKTTEPLRINLADIQDTEKKGKWWLVGASYHDPAKLASSTAASATKHDDSDTGYESATPGSVNLTRLAKKQGMNTDVRRAIFVSLLSASDYQDAHVRLMKLHLKNKQQLEIPRVIVTCVGGEETYNPYYALVARRICAQHQLRKAFQFMLWGFWRDIENEAEGDEDNGEVVNVRKVVNLAKFYGALVADGSLSVAILKKLDFALLPAKQSMFVEVFLTGILFQLRQDASKDRTNDDSDRAFEEKVRRAFTCAGGTEMLSGVQYFISNTIEGSELARTKKQKKALKVGSRVAIETLAKVKSEASAMDNESDGESDI